MSENLHELCCSLVEEFYGELHARLFSCLSYHGRLTTPAIAQKLRLPLRQVKYGLAALVQCRLAYHHTTPDGLSTYQANSSSAYHLIRTGRLIDLVQKQVGTYGARVISEALILGFSSIAELEAKSMGTILSDRKSLANGDLANEPSDVEHLSGVRSAIEALVSLKYLVNVRSAHFQTSFDVSQDVERYLKNRGLLPTTKGKKGLNELEDMIAEQVRDRTATDKPEYGFANDVHLEKKRAWHENGDEKVPKRQKINNGMSARANGHSDVNSAAGSNTNGVVVYVTFNNLISETRNRYLSSRATKVFGTTCSSVLNGALSQIPSTDQWSRTIGEAEVDLLQLRQELNQTRESGETNGHHPNGTAKVNGIHTYEYDDLEDARISYKEVDRNVALLADGEFGFLHGSYGKEWRINKKEVDNFVQQHEILRLIDDRLGSPALRILRVLIDKGKLDEKSLQELGLLGAKDLRQTLAQLKQMGYIDLQEVPRESQRLPTRTIFLWFYDSERVQKILLDVLYKSMSRLMDRLSMQRKKVSSTLEKIERSDVQGNEEQVMSAAELRVLKRWQRMERWILGELARLDESVILLRDL